MLRIVLFSKNGALKILYRRILYYSHKKDIEMVKFLVNTLAENYREAYEKIDKKLKQNLSAEDYNKLFDNTEKSR